jgi:hypothetical protein
MDCWFFDISKWELCRSIVGRLQRISNNMNNPWNTMDLNQSDMPGQVRSIIISGGNLYAGLEKCLMNDICCWNLSVVFPKLAFQSCAEMKTVVHEFYFQSFRIQQSPSMR